VRNGGNRAVTAFLSAEDPELVLGFEFQPARLDVPAGGTQASELNVRTQRQPSTSPRQHRFVVTTSADGATAQATGSFVQTPAETPILHRRGGQLGLRLLLTLLAAALLIGGSFAAWANGSNSKALCRHQSPDDCLNYAYTINKIAGTSVTHDATEGHRKAFYFVASAGFVTIVLGVLALLGLRKGRSTWLAGILALAFLIVIAVRIGHGGGLAIPFVGAILAIVAGFLPTVFRDA